MQNNLTRVPVPTTQPDGSTKLNIRLKNLSGATGQTRRDSAVSLGTIHVAPSGPPVTLAMAINRAPLTRWATPEQTALFQRNGSHNHLEIFNDDLMFDDWSETLDEALYL